MKTNILFKILLIFFFYSFNSYAQKVSNVTFIQEQSNIIISYDLDSKTPCKVSLFVSTDDGITWQGPLKKLIGDAGAKITSGNHSITWNVLEEFQELKGDNIRFQVLAELENNENIETVVIGNQEWMKYNLDTRYYRNGDLIPEIKESKKWELFKKGAWCFYENEPKNGYHYGKLYNWYAINDPRGLAPKGFHIPTDEEWQTLINYLGGYDIAGSKMKQKGTRFWAEPNTDANNNSGFEALPGGCRDNIGGFNVLKYCGTWWSLSKFDFNKIYLISLYWSSGIITKEDTNKQLGLSVRCIKD
jgi:uncharacterized protein (TIGR02145 family)